MKHRIESLAQIETKARRLAHSGAYREFSVIRRQLEKTEDCDDLELVFRNRWTQSEINRLCDLARPVE
jgi:hypothetical protein